MQCQVLSYFLLAVLTSSWCSFFPPSPYQVLINSIRRGTVWRLSFPACPPAAFCLCLKCFICVSPKVETVTELAHTPTWFGTAIRSLILPVIAGRALKNDCKWLFPTCWIWKEHFNDFKQKKNNCAYLTFYNIHCSCTYSHGSHKNINIDSSFERMFFISLICDRKERCWSRSRGRCECGRGPVSFWQPAPGESRPWRPPGACWPAAPASWPCSASYRGWGKRKS